MIDCPRHGRLLYGQRCHNCDCGAPYHGPRPFLRPALDEIRISKPARFKIDEVDLGEIRDFNFTISREQMEAMARRQREAVDRAIYDSIRVTDPPWGFDTGYEPGRSRSAGRAGESYIVEVITDPADRRGLDARAARKVA